MFDSLKSNQTITIKTTEMSPISSQERFPVIDVLRGIAILCILFLNMYPFCFPDNLQNLYTKVFNGMNDKIVFEFIEFFGRGKFYSMLSFLFGLGMAIQVSRSMDTDKKFSLLYSRRLFLLLAIGLFHDIFLWGGVILIIYSSMGFFLLFFKERHPKTLLVWAVIFMIVPTLVNIAFPHKNTRTPTAPHVINQTQQTTDMEMKQVQEAIKIYREGSYWDMFHLRLQKIKRTALVTARAGWGILGLFLVGIWAWQKRIFQELEKNLKFLKKTGWFSLFVGLVGTSIFFILDKAFKSGQPLYVEIIGDLAHTAGTTALSFFYIISIVLLMGSNTGKKVLKPFAAVGRMALSNYFLQSLLCTTLFYSYGFKLFGKISPLVGFLLVFPISAVQILFSAWWAKHFRFGPVEWFWRSLTYGKRQKMVLK